MLTHSITAVAATLKTINQFMRQQGIEGSLSYRHEVSRMVRCGRSQISLNVAEQSEKYVIELQQGKRKISGSTTAPNGDLDKLKSLVMSLNERIQYMPEVAHMTPMTAIAQTDLARCDTDPALANIDSSMMVDLFKQTQHKFAQLAVEISGAFSAGIYSYAIINTLVDEPVTYQGSDYNIELVLQLLDQDKKELRVADVGASLAQYRPNALIDELVRSYQIKTSTPRQDLSAGEYDVVFHRDAFAELVHYLSFMALHGETYQYGMGMLQKQQHQLGDKLFSSKLTISDDPTDTQTLFQRPVGLNGVARPSVNLIEQGVLKHLYYSNKDDCDRFNVERNNDYDAASLKVHPGDGPTDFKAMVKSCIKPTLYIGYIHYMNVTQASKGEFTGTSRFGTYLLADGEIKAHLYNLRINDAYPRLFNNIEWLSAQLSHANISNTYGMRLASSIACPLFVKVNQVPITGSSGSSDN
ncbi:metallopeptidase TldD-related protein [Motilimonas sp. KMU-193]|uniref:metallopeptidase TldD-related protein n=1 Tax=Motilimonas sp. KMU-193 TaxID=3388668 RepID=UPI00396B0444